MPGIKLDARSYAILILVTMSILLSVKLVAQRGTPEVADVYSSSRSSAEIAAATQAVAEATDRVAQSNLEIARSIDRLAGAVSGLGAALSGEEGATRRNNAAATGEEPMVNLGPDSATEGDLEEGTFVVD